MREITGFLNILKPSGETSFRVVSQVKKILGTKKVGHLGTLDPAAAGVLPIAVGKATKFFEYFLNKDKEYVAMVKFGIATDTLDSFGQLIRTDDTIIEAEQIEAVIPAFIGEVEQIPPRYSAIKVNGKRAYELARENADFTISPRKITIFSIKLIKKCEKNTFLFKVHCSAGTYIRTLFADIAEKLSTVAVTPVIIRTKSGNFLVNDAITLEELEKNKKIIPIIQMLGDISVVNVNEKIAKQLACGVKIDAKSLEMEDFSDKFFICHGEKLLGLYSVSAGRIVCEIFLDSNL